MTINLDKPIHRLLWLREESFTSVWDGKSLDTKEKKCQEPGPPVESGLRRVPQAICGAQDIWGMTHSLWRSNTALDVMECGMKAISAAPKLSLTKFTCSLIFQRVRTLLWKVKNCTTHWRAHGSGRPPAQPSKQHCCCSHPSPYSPEPAPDPDPSSAFLPSALYPRWPQKVPCFLASYRGQLMWTTRRKCEDRRREWGQDIIQPNPPSFCTTFLKVAISSCERWATPLLWLHFSWGSHNTACCPCPFRSRDSLVSGGSQHPCGSPEPYAHLLQYHFKIICCFSGIQLPSETLKPYCLWGTKRKEFN